MGTIFYENESQTVEVKRIGLGVGKCGFLITTDSSPLSTGEGQALLTSTEFLQLVSNLIENVINNHTDVRISEDYIHHIVEEAFMGDLG